MKRIANFVAIQTILYSTNPQATIKIIDYENSYDEGIRKNGKEKFFGKVANTIGAYWLTRELEAEVRHVDVEIIDSEPVIVFSVVTNEEEYK